MADNNGAFPKLVMDIGPATQRAAPSVASPLAQRVENRLREVLAWRPRSGDPRSFVAALNQAFTIRDVAGHTEWEWTPRSYAIQADMGAVTGAQASIYARARAALDQSRPLIEALYPLRPDADKEDVDSIRALVLAQWHELVNELGRVGGPRLQRIDGLFDSLLGKDFEGDDDPEDVGGLLGVMRERFGFDEDRVNRIDEEQNWTNYLILVDHTIGLLRSWTAVEHYFDSTGADVFLGTQLVLLSRALDVITESVRSARMLMESVFLSEGEQQIVRLESGLTIDDLLTWIESFASHEAKQIIRDAGKDGVVALQPTLDTLLELVHSAREQAEAGAQNPQPGFHTLRVQNALSELEQHIERAADLASKIRRGALRVTRVFPDTIDLDTFRTGSYITVDGAGFEPGATVKLFKPNGQGTNVTVENVIVVSETRLFMLLDDDTRNKLAPGEWSLIVVNPDDEESDPHGTLTVTGQPPQAKRKQWPSGGAPPDTDTFTLEPNSAKRGETLNVTITSTGGKTFDEDATVTFSKGIYVISEPIVTERTVTVEILVRGDTKAGPYGVALTMGGELFWLKDAFIVEEDESDSSQSGFTTGE
ncbi:MAG: hypothetical protein N2378_08225 [Chloroflexaceae bacterium]|nr:hypothetical protein [Chloroflexaceae bacterium]